MKLILTCPECGDSNWAEHDDGFECLACGEFAYPEDMTANTISSITEDPTIDRFNGEFEFLSNFYGVPVVYDGIRYRNSEAAFQAQKTLDPELRETFAELPPAQAKRLGREVELRPDWKDVRIGIMYEICKCKFTQNTYLKEKLLATGDATLIEGNTWNDKFWGVCDGEGKNNLGKILMKIREELSNIR